MIASDLYKLPDNYFSKDSGTLTVEAIKEAREGWWTESMKTRDDRLAWWREGRLGCFVHWGAYTALNNVWQGKIHGGYGEHIQRVSKIFQADYKEHAVEQFNPTGFDADEWIRLVRDAGFKYFVITAKHHDGFAMWDSKVSDYNIVAATPFKRDPMRELKDACDTYGIKFGLYYSHAFDWGEEFGLGNDWEYENPGGNKHLKGGHNWWDECPELRRTVVEKHVNSKAIPQILELIQNYDPDILWFDTPHKLPLHENIRILKTIRQAKPDIVVNGRLARGVGLNLGDYINTGDRAAEYSISGGDWESIPTTNESYGHNLYDKTHKPASFFVELFAKAISRNGNILMNIGPMGDGRIDPLDVTILEGIRDWMKDNEKSLRNCGQSGLPIQEWGVTTRQDNTVYLHVTQWPEDNQLIVGGLKSDPSSAAMLVSGESVTWERLNDLDIQLQLPTPVPSDTHLVVKLTFAATIQTDPIRRLPETRAARLMVFDAERMATPFSVASKVDDEPQKEEFGEIEERPVGAIAADAPDLLKGDESLLAYGDGKIHVPRYFAHNWISTKQWFEWTVRVDRAARYRVTLQFVPGMPNGGGDYRADFGCATLSGTVPEDLPDGEAKVATVEELGDVVLPRGIVTIKLMADRIGEGELMRPLELNLIPHD